MSGINPLNMFGGAPGQAGNTNAPENFGMNAQANSIYQNTLGDYQNLYNSYNGGANSNYVQSMVNPTIQTNASQYGNLMQDQANRGVRGSSFGDQSISNFTNAANTNVANTQAQAMQNQFGMQNYLLGGMTGIGNQYNAQAQSSLNSAVKQNSDAAQNNLAAQGQNGKMFGGLLSGIAGVF